MNISKNTKNLTDEEMINELKNRIEEKENMLLGSLEFSKKLNNENRSLQNQVDLQQLYIEYLENVLTSHGLKFRKPFAEDLAEFEDEDEKMCLHCCGNGYNMFGECKRCG